MQPLVGGHGVRHVEQASRAPSALDYIIVAELAHLAEPNHTPEFWLRVGRAFPEYDQRKQWLAENGADIDLV